jgi:uracil-DNA glycosylase
VRAGNANSHAGQGWETFTAEVLRAVSKARKGIVFLAWGSPAQKRIDSIGIDKAKHCILRSVHPSPLSAARGFFDCKHFLKANEWLRHHYGVEGQVEWDSLADGRQGRGLPPARMIQDGKEKKPGIGGGDSATATIALENVETKKVCVSTKEYREDRRSPDEDAYEFDEAELAQLP